MRGTHTVYPISLQWRHNGRDSVSNHQPHDCLLSRLFRRRSKKTSKLRVTGLCAGNSPATGEFPAQMASNAENVSIWWRHHVNSFFFFLLLTAFTDFLQGWLIGTWEITSSWQWRYNEPDGRSKKTSKPRVAGLCVGNSPVNSPHKWPITRNMFPFDDVIMIVPVPVK